VPSWQIEGDYAECATANFLCPCLPTLPRPSDLRRLRVAQLYAIRKGASTASRSRLDFSWWR